jgi:glucose/arabinose dehydrogenase
MSATKVELSYPDYAGRVRHLHSGPDGALYVGDETRNLISRITPE